MEVTLVLRNGSPHQLGYNLCDSGLEQWRGGAWIRVPQGSACQRILYGIDTGREARYSKRLPALLDPGEYRFRTNVDFHRDTPQRTISYGNATIYSEVFRVGR